MTPAQELCKGCRVYLLVALLLTVSTCAGSNGGGCPEADCGLRKLVGKVRSHQPTHVWYRIASKCCAWFRVLLLSGSTIMHLRMCAYSVSAQHSIGRVYCFLVCLSWLSLPEALNTIILSNGPFNLLLSDCQAGSQLSTLHNKQHQGFLSLQPCYSASLGTSG